MKATQIILLVACAAGLPACALQGEQSFTPTGVTLNHSTRLGTDALGNSNPFKQQSRPYVEQVTNNHYYNDTHTDVVQNSPVVYDPGYIVLEPRY
jgi:hypothetical protein